MSPIFVLALIFVLAVIALAVFIGVVIAIHSEPRHQMTARAHGPLTTTVRRMLGVYVGMPGNADPIEDDREECLTGNSTDWWNNGRLGR
jgi:hypothetical protein